MELMRKLEILADAAKYDASCASSDTHSRNTVGGWGMGSSEGAGIDSNRLRVRVAPAAAAQQAFDF